MIDRRMLKACGLRLAVICACTALVHVIRSDADRDLRMFAALGWALIGMWCGFKAARDSDGSGAAGETNGLDPKGDSAGRSAASPSYVSDPQSQKA